MSSSTINDGSSLGDPSAKQKILPRYRAISFFDGDLVSLTVSVSESAIPARRRAAEKYREKTGQTTSVDSTLYHATRSCSAANRAAMAVLPVPERPETNVAGN